MRISWWLEKDLIFPSSLSLILSIYCNTSHFEKKRHSGHRETLSTIFSTPFLSRKNTAKAMFQKSWRVRCWQKIPKIIIKTSLAWLQSDNTIYTPELIFGGSVRFTLPKNLEEWAYSDNFSHELKSKHKLIEEPLSYAQKKSKNLVLILY